jgi:hypothetical protein
VLSIKLAEQMDNDDEYSPEKQSITRDDTRLKPRNISANALMDEECRKEYPDNPQYLVVGGMNVDMMDMDMAAADDDERKSP